MDVKKTSLSFYYAFYSVIMSLSGETCINFFPSKIPKVILCTSLITTSQNHSLSFTPHLLDTDNLLLVLTISSIFRRKNDQIQIIFISLQRKGSSSLSSLEYFMEFYTKYYSGKVFLIWRGLVSLQFNLTDPTACILDRSLLQFVFTHILTLTEQLRIRHKFRSR